MEVFFESAPIQMHHAVRWCCTKQEDLWRAVEVNPDRAVIETNK